MSHPERIVPDKTDPGIVALHLKRYEFARPWCDGRDVLDAGCGVGYGAAFLAESAKRVVGVDRDAETIDYARRRYARPNLEFVADDLLDLGLTGDSFDAVCAFETIEHLPDRDAFLGHVARVLRPGGIFLVSTPRADETTTAPENPFHAVEFSRADFEELLRRYFADVALFGESRLQTTRHRLMQRLDVLGLRRRLTWLRPASRLLGTPPMAQVGTDDIVISASGLERATELIGVCGDPLR